MSWSLVVWGSLSFPPGGLKAWRKLQVDPKAYAWPIEFAKMTSLDAYGEDEPLMEPLKEDEVAGGGAVVLPRCSRSP